MKIAMDAPNESNILCMLADTAERYLSSLLFENIEEEMSEEELEIFNSTN
jgi:cysteine synthase A